MERLVVEAQVNGAGSPGTRSTDEVANRDDASSTAIEFRNVRKVYHPPGKDGSVIALQDVSLSIGRGEFVALVGRSGCGKSTALKLAAGLVSPDSGEILLNGTPARAGRRDAGLMLQSAALLPWRTVLANVALPLQVMRKYDSEARDRCMQVLRLVGLDSYAKAHPWQLSGGMQRRVSLARLLVVSPDIVLMDEPFTGLDEFTRESLSFELARLQEERAMTALYVTHSIQEAVTLADRVVVMHGHPGRIGGDIRVPLPRPRTPDILDMDEFVQTVSQVRNTLGAV